MSRRLRFQYRLSRARLLVAIVAVVFAVIVIPARGGSQNYSFLFVGPDEIETSGGLTGGIVVVNGDIRGGVLFHTRALGPATVLECAELVEAADGSLIFYARGFIVGGDSWYMKIVDVRDGVGAAVGGIEISETSPNHCGAAAIPLRFSYQYTILTYY